MAFFILLDILDMYGKEWVERKALSISQMVSQLFFMGSTGWDMPIQMIKLVAENKQKA